jgi:cbb3-type cytochrome oxidase subunit 3
VIVFVAVIAWLYKKTQQIAAKPAEGESVKLDKG